MTNGLVLMSGAKEPKNLPFLTQPSSGIPEVYPLSAFTSTIPARVYGAIHHRGEVLNQNPTCLSQHTSCWRRMKRSYNLLAPTYTIPTRVSAAFPIYRAKVLD